VGLERRELQARARNGRPSQGRQCTPNIVKQHKARHAGAHAWGTPEFWVVRRDVGSTIMGSERLRREGEAKTIFPMRHRPSPGGTCVPCRAKATIESVNKQYTREVQHVKESCAGPLDRRHC